jgi:ribonuclease PH
MSYERKDKRTIDQLRNTKITPNISPYAEGSALIEVGNTKVICTRRRSKTGSRRFCETRGPAG